VEVPGAVVLGASFAADGPADVLECGVVGDAGAEEL
jgi:hypothetical protein